MIRGNVRLLSAGGTELPEHRVRTEHRILGGLGKERTSCGCTKGTMINGGKLLRDIKGSKSSHTVL